MRVLVTGGSGHIGRWVVRELVAQGHQVVNADRLPPPNDPATPEVLAAPYREVDLTDVGQVADALAGADAVVHLGAIPHPVRHPGEVVFRNNVLSTFAVLQAAALLGVRRAVFASSVSALGTAYAVRPFAPLYAPVDEAHPLLGQDPYALSKEVDERTGAMFHRRTGMQVLAFRFHWVARPGEAAARARLPDTAERYAHLLWGYTDVRDAALACRLGVEAAGLGFEEFNITAADTLLELPTEEALRRYAPQVEVRAPIPGTGSAWSIEKARRLLGYEPQRSWRVDEDAAG